LSVNVAVTELAAVIGTVHMPVPLQPPPPLQPVNVEPVAGAAVSVTVVPWPNVPVHVAPQSIPAGTDVTVPVPVPAFVTASAYVFSVNVAVTALAAVIGTVHVPVPVQPPLQPVNVEPVAGAAVSVTVVPWPNVPVHVAPQSIPAGADVTVPTPVPAFVTASAYVFSVNVAVTEFAPVIATVQVPVPLQPPPLQPVNVVPVAGAAVSVTVVPWPNVPVQVAPQSIPAGADVTVPTPMPAFVTASAYVFSVNVAVTVIAAVIVTVQVPVPLHPPPLQPVNVEPVPAAAVNVTIAPLRYGSVQSEPQVIPLGLDVTVPVPVPVFATVSAYGASAKSALTVVAAVTETTHVPVPLQPPPLQPPKTDPAAGAAVSVTIDP
jgi:hypothetical protein